MTVSFLRLQTVIERTGLSRSTIYQRIKDGTFPAPIKLGTRSVAWVDADIDSWLAQQIQRHQTGQWQRNH